jgi:hypothetical protein
MNQALYEIRFNINPTPNGLQYECFRVGVYYPALIDGNRDRVLDAIIKGSDEQGDFALLKFDDNSEEMIRNITHWMWVGVEQLAKFRHDYATWRSEQEG